VTPPALEIADLIRTAGAAFVERNRQWIRRRHVKVLRALRGVVRLRSAGISMTAPAAHIVPRSRITAAVIAIAQSVRPLLANGGSPPDDENCSLRATYT
jgi:hypothetical protein